MPDPVELPDDPDEPIDLEERLNARERAFELLYEADLKDRTIDEVLSELPVAPDSFTVRVLTEAGRHREEIDADLIRVSKGWSLERMPVLDRAILRMGVAELGWLPDVPTAVIINEAVELAKVFSTDASGRFVNGVLSRLADDYRPGSGSRH